MSFQKNERQERRTNGCANCLLSSNAFHFGVDNGFDDFGRSLQVFAVTCDYNISDFRFPFPFSMLGLTGVLMMCSFVSAPWVVQLKGACVTLQQSMTIDLYSTSNPLCAGRCKNPESE